jgi:hypothetical protein
MKMQAACSGKRSGFGKAGRGEALLPSIVDARMSCVFPHAFGGGAAVPRDRFRSEIAVARDAAGMIARFSQALSRDQGEPTRLLQ